jgi:molybdopterin-containing oxidoreductase family iron-sulfur binding subunit
MARYGMAIDLNKCVGCRTCMIACKVENGTPAGHFFMYTFRFEEGEFPEAMMRFLPRPCMHCENPPCVEACPADSRIKWKDGLVLTDVDNCQGIRACESACPYGVNYFNITDPKLNEYLDWQHEDLKPITGGVRPDWNPELEARFTWDDDPTKPERRLAGSGHRVNTVGKCTFCVHRLEKGITETACQQACPTTAIFFGDLDDPNSEVSQAIAAAGTAVFRLKTDKGTDPKVFYLGEAPLRDARMVERVPVPEGVQLNGDPEIDGAQNPWK